MDSQGKCAVLEQMRIKKKGVFKFQHIMKDRQEDSEDVQRITNKHGAFHLEEKDHSGI